MSSLSTVINTCIDNALLDIHTFIPAIVQSYSNGKVSVIPAIKRQYINGIKQLPIINDVPVMFPQSKNSIVSFPLEKGDEVMLVFAERSVDVWKRDGGIVNPDITTKRKFDLSDAFAYPIGRTQVVDGNKLQVKHKNAIISMNADSKLSIGNDTDELLDIVSDLADILKTIATDVTGTVTGTCPSGGGPLVAGTIVAGASGALKAALVTSIDNIKTRIGTIKQ